MSRGTVFVDLVEIITEHCCACGVVFAFPLTLQRKLLDNRSDFYCPSGHAQRYTINQADKERERAERAEQMRDAAEARAKAAREERDTITKAHHRMRARVANGVCPCCNRTFQNLLSHMKSEHPDFTEAKSLHALPVSFGLTQTQVANEAGVPQNYVSLYEQDKPMPSTGRARLDRWVERYASKGIA